MRKKTMTTNIKTLLKYIENGEEILDEEFEYLRDGEYDNVELEEECDETFEYDYTGIIPIIILMHGKEIYSYNNGEKYIAIEFSSYGEGYMYNSMYFVEKKKVITYKWVKEQTIIERIKSAK